MSPSTKVVALVLWLSPLISAAACKRNVSAAAAGLCASRPGDTLSLLQVKGKIFRGTHRTNGCETACRHHASMYLYAQEPTEVGRRFDDLDSWGEFCSTTQAKEHCAGCAQCAQYTPSAGAGPESEASSANAGADQESEEPQLSIADGSAAAAAQRHLERISNDRDTYSPGQSHAIPRGGLAGDDWERVGNALGNVEVFKGTLNNHDTKLLWPWGAERHEIQFGQSTLQTLIHDVDFRNEVMKRTGDQSEQQTFELKTSLWGTEKFIIAGSDIAEFLANLHECLTPAVPDPGPSEEDVNEATRQANDDDAQQTAAAESRAGRTGNIEMERQAMETKSRREQIEKAAQEKFEGNFRNKYRTMPQPDAPKTPRNDDGTSRITGVGRTAE